MVSSISNKFYMPTRVISGRNCIMSHSDLLRSFGKKALIVTGARSAKINGSQDDIIAALDAVGIGYTIFDKVMANPTVACVYEGADYAKTNNVDFIIAIGGGSPMDAGKAIALLAAQEIAEENLFLNQFEKILPMVFVPTTAGTGSEVTQYAILTNDRAQTKMSIASDLLFPTLAFLDAKYMELLSKEVTINTAIDALSHAVEGMLSVRASLISDTLALESTRLICNILKSEILQNQGQGLSLEVREQLLQASCLSGMVIAQTGATVVHSMGYSLTYFKGTDHGRANGLLLGEYLRMVERELPDLTAKIFSAMGLSGVDDFQELMNSLLGNRDTVTAQEVSQFSKIAIKARNIPNGVIKTTEDDISQMFLKSLHIQY